MMPRVKSGVQPRNEIWYTSTDGNVVVLYTTAGFGAPFKSNTYENGQGVIKFDGDVTTIIESAFVERLNLASIIIPEGVTTIKSNAFASCTSLASITLPEGLTAIGSNVFNGCSALTSIAIPEKVTAIGSYAFHGCTSLTTIVCLAKTAPTVPSTVFGSSTDYYAGRSTYDSSENALYVPEDATGYNKGYWNSVLCSGSTCGFSVIPYEKRNRYIRYKSNNGSKISFSGLSVVSNTYGVTGAPLGLLELSEDLISIPSYVCESSKTKLHRIYFPESLATIEEHAFDGCSGLTLVKLPQAVKSVGAYAFSPCRSLHTAYSYPKDPPTAGSGIFNSVASGFVVYVPTGSESAYKAATNWSNYTIQGF